MPLIPPPSHRREEPLHSVEEVVPARLVLTELARGFLLSQGDPVRASRFARRFLHEQATIRAPENPPPLGLVSRSLRDRGPRPPEL